MSAPANPPGSTTLARHRGLHEIWRTPPGLGRLSAVNHTIVGMRFMITACIFFAIGGVLAMLLRAQLATSHSAFMDPDTYNQMFTMHGTVMMFLFAIPLIEGFAIYMLPKFLGARDLAFPRISAFGYWCFLFGGALLIGAMLMGLAPDSGWFMYTPLSSRPFSPGINSDVWLLGVTFVEVSAVCAAVEFVVTVLKVRAPGMAPERMPIIGWYLLVTAFMMLVGFPPLILASILLELERAFGLPFFDPTRGGDPLLWQHLFWLFGHPEVYIIFLPAAGMVSTILPVFAGRDLMGYTWIVVSIVALAFLSFGLWVHHMFVVGIPHLGLAFFSAASLLVVVPTGVQIFAWLGTLATGKPRLSVPMLYIIGFFAIFVIGGLTGVMVAVVPFDWQVHDTHFVVAHLHYVLIGGFVFPALAAIYHWLPLASGRSPRFDFGVPAFWLLFIGFNATFLVMHLTGLLGMPRRIYTYGADTGWDWPNLASSIGAFVMAFGFALVAADLLMRARFGRPRPRNPWGATTLEWATPIPVPSYNFASLPRVASRSPLRDDPALPHRLARGEGHLAEPRHGWQETICVDMASGRPESVLVLPRATFLPLWTALATGLFFGGVLLQLYAVALAGAFLTLALALAWTRTTGAPVETGALPIAVGEAAPPHWETPRPPSWWAMAFTLGSNGTLFASLAFGAIFLATVGAGGPPRTMLVGGEMLSLAAAVALLLAAAAGTLAARALPRGAVVATALALVATLAAQAAAAAMLAMLALSIPAPHDHALGACSLVLAVYAMLHAALGAVLAGYCLWRLRNLHLAPTRAADVRTCSLWHGYTAAAGIAAIALVHALATGLIG